jgi:acetoin utilization deacetylase AcuC-like enzyme
VSGESPSRAAAKPPLYFSDPACLEHDPRRFMPQHPESPERLSAIRERLREREWLGWERCEAPAADEGELELIHTPAHLARIGDLSRCGGGAIDADTFVGEASYEAARHAAGGACAMARALISGEAAVGFCETRPPGHHAEPERAMGFCLFDNLAIAAELAIAELGARRVFVFDWDVHHGNGTAEAFRRRPDVLVAGIHQSGIFPGSGSLADVGSGEGEGYTLNLPVPTGSGEELWLSLLEHIAIPAAAEFGPDLILISAGFDGHRADPLADCRLETASYAEMARHLRDLAVSLEVPIGAVLEGGYNPPVLAECVEATLAALAGEGEAHSAAPEALLTSRAAAQIGRYWEL